MPYRTIPREFIPAMTKILDGKSVAEATLYILIRLRTWEFRSNNTLSIHHIGKIKIYIYQDGAVHFAIPDNLLNKNGCDGSIIIPISLGFFDRRKVKKIFSFYLKKVKKELNIQEKENTLKQIAEKEVKKVENLRKLVSVLQSHIDEEANHIWDQKPVEL